MPRFENDNDARRLGEALAALRVERGLSQAQAGERAGMSGRAWDLYEPAKPSGLFWRDVQRRLTAALDSTPQDLALTLNAPVSSAPEAFARDVGDRGRSCVGKADPAAAARRSQLSNDELAPWTPSGVRVAFEPGRWPSHDQGSGRAALHRRHAARPGRGGVLAADRGTGAAQGRGAGCADAGPRRLVGAAS